MDSTTRTKTKKSGGRISSSTAADVAHAATDAAADAAADVAADAKGALLQKHVSPAIGDDDWLSSGSTLLNLAISERYDGGFAKGLYFLLVGNSASGKSFLSLTCLAEAAMNPHFDEHRFIYDNVERGALMDIERFFGKAVARRMEPPSWDDGTPRYSETVEDFYYHLDDALSAGPCIYVLDSMDGLTSEYEHRRFHERKAASRNGREWKGDYGGGQAKINSSSLRQMLGGLRDTGSILIIINQTRDKINALPFESPVTRSGGRALTFYATLELWTSIASRITKIVGGKKRQLGIVCQIKVKKNRIIGRERTVNVPIYHSLGIDDVGSCVQYLLDEGYWKMAGKLIVATGLGSKISATEEKLIEWIEQDGLTDRLKMLVARVWQDIERKCAVVRKSRYTEQ